MTHTKGPWTIRAIDHIDPLYLYKTVCDTIPNSNMGIAIVTNLTEGDTNKANARLIASAPDLLEALEYVLRNLDTKPLPKHDIRKHCTEAIQKARGQ